MNLGIGSYEFCHGSIKISYDLDDGSINLVVRDILNIINEDSVIVITKIKSIEPKELHLDLEYTKVALDEFKKYVQNKVILSTISKIYNNTDVSIDEYNYSLFWLRTMARNNFINITTLFESSIGNTSKLYVLNEDKGTFIINYCETERYLKLTDYSLFYICRNHVDNLVKLGGYILSNDPNLLATKLNDKLEEVIHEFNIANATKVPEKKKPNFQDASLNNGYPEFKLHQKPIIISKDFMFPNGSDSQVLLEPSIDPLSIGKDTLESTDEEVKNYFEEE